MGLSSRQRFTLRLALAISLLSTAVPLLKRSGSCVNHGSECFSLAGSLRNKGRRRLGNIQRRAEPSEADFNYGEAGYWDSRYLEDGDKSSYDWLGEYDKFREYIEDAVSRTGGDRSVAILDLGCGNAKLAEEMYDDGYTNITAVDISEVAISMMRKRNAQTRPNIRWVVGDAFALDFEDNTFDLVIDKSTMDALSCEDGKNNQNMVKLTAEVIRVLRTGGAYLVFSATESASRSLTLPHLDFSSETKDIPVPFAKLEVGIAIKSPGADERLAIGKTPTLENAVQYDEAQIQRRKAQEEAERRLREKATSASFDLLD